MTYNVFGGTLNPTLLYAVLCVYVVSGKFTIKSLQWLWKCWVVVARQSDVTNDSEFTVSKSCESWQAQSHSQLHHVHFLAAFLQQTRKCRLKNPQSAI